ncbi:MAG TPA: sigma-70 family RNA polymerase sigma factor [Polyangiaceae bacterium]|nr:sigma-70 family RNA polymerase sigma factor [Polyangiaceae bacterium]
MRAAASPRAGSNGDATLVEQYRELVQRIAGRIHRRAPPSVRREDLVAAGMSGLWDALRRRAGRPGESFEYYVCRRVRGAILDELRAEDWLPRRRRGAGPSRVVLHLDDLGSHEQNQASLAEDTDGEELTGRKRAVERIRAGLDRLPPRERYVLTMRDLDDVPIKELGEALGVSRPRVCQLRSQALRRLRAWLEDAA